MDVYDMQKIKPFNYNFILFTRLNSFKCIIFDAKIDYDTKTIQ